MGKNFFKKRWIGVEGENIPFAIFKGYRKKLCPNELELLEVVGGRQYFKYYLTRQVRFLASLKFNLSTV